MEENNVALAAELMQGEAAVVALHTQQLSVFESLAAERTALVQRNSELASKMAEDHTALERMKAEAAAALEAVARENEELSARNAALSAEMEAMAGTEAAALAISLAEARAALTLAEGRCKELAEIPLHFAIDDMQIAEDLQMNVGHMLMQELSRAGSGRKA